MRLNEVIRQVDLSKRAIKFYEEKGLLKTKRIVMVIEIILRMILVCQKKFPHIEKWE